MGFKGLPEEVILRIVDKFLLELEQQLGERAVSLVATESARAFFAKEGFSEEFGAREMGRVVQEHVKRPLADEILFGKLAQGGTAEIDHVDGKVVIRAIPRPARPVGADNAEEDDEVDASEDTDA
jgi:ATP-dependent Clp protease ATP-binding subunit ClpA